MCPYEPGEFEWPLIVPLRAKSREAYCGSMTSWS